MTLDFQPVGSGEQVRLQKCRLCQKTAFLRNSHMLPSFVFKWLKASSATGFLRFGKNVDKRVQDGIKRYWLCDHCEQLFCGWEQQFASKVFHPLTADGGQSIEYGDWMLKFCVSISWRVLSTFVEDDSLENFNANQKEASRRALLTWSRFLLGFERHPGPYEQHFLPMGLLGDISGDQLPSNINRYMLRSVDATPAVGRGGAIIYTKLERFIIVGFIDIESPRQWVGTKIHVRSGRVGQGNFTLPKGFGAFLLERCRMGAELQEGMSEKQKDTIEQSMRTNRDRLLTSETLQALHQDVRLFGENVFKSPEDKGKN